MADAKDKDQQAKAAEPEAEKPKAAKAKAKKGDDKPKAAKARKAAKPKAESKAKAEAKADAKAEDKPAEDKPKRRGSAETGAKANDGAAPSAPTNADGLVEVRAKAKFVRTAPRKARLVMDHIRGKSVPDARAILAHTPRAAATDVRKVLESAIANAENNFELDPGDLRIYRATVDEGPTIKRFRPRAMGRATPIHKRTSHMTITLTTAGNGAGRADTRKARK
jgi:ribosomal protein L22